MADEDVKGRVAGLSSARCVGGAWDGAVSTYHYLPREAWVRLCANPCGDVLWARRCEIECFRCFFFCSCHGCVWLGWQDGLDADPVHPSQKRVYLGKANIDMRSNPVGPHPFMQSAALLSWSSVFWRPLPRGGTDLQWSDA
jgi:hypothetical protein